MRTIITTIGLIAALSAAAQNTIIEVSPSPYAIEQALQKARQMRLHGETDTVSIRLSGGTYHLQQPIVLRPDDSNTIIDSDGDVIVSGGVRVDGWQKRRKGNNNVYVADMPLFCGRPLLIRQMWVNGRKAVRARDVSDYEKMNRIIGFNREREEIYVSPKAVNQIKNTQSIEMVLQEMCGTTTLRIREIETRGDTATVRFHNPESHVLFMRSWPTDITSDSSINPFFFLTGTKELMDTPGEWSIDEREGKLYYIPLNGEDMSKAEVIVPALETLLLIEGTPDDPVCNVRIEDISFSHAAWLRPSLNGHVALRAGMYLTETYRISPQIERSNGDQKLNNQGWVGRPAAAIKAVCASDIIISDCTVEHCGSTAIDFDKSTNRCAIGNCTITDCGGSGILCGSFGSEAHEIHKTYDPADRRIVCRNMRINDNRIIHIGNEDWGTLGIGAGYVRDIVIEGNDISEVPFCGISIGWGWNQQPGAMANNKVIGNYVDQFGKHTTDAAAIYTMGSQPHSLIEGNMIGEVCRPNNGLATDKWFYLYTGEGSSGFTIRNNRAPSERFQKEACGPGNEWENNGPKTEP